MVVIAQGQAMHLPRLNLNLDPVSDLQKTSAHEYDEISFLPIHAPQSMASMRLQSCVAHTLRPLCKPGLRAILIAPVQSRTATTSSLPRSGTPPHRRAVTVVSDTGQVPWKQLSIGEKAARSTQQSFNFLIVLVGIGMTVGVGTVLWLEVFSSDSKTAVFNRAADRVRRDERCIELLAGRGHGREIESYGEASWSRWARNRFIAYAIASFLHEQ